MDISTLLSVTYKADKKSGEDRKIKLYNQSHLIGLEKITAQSRNIFCQ